MDNSTEIICSFLVNVWQILMLQLFFYFELNSLNYLMLVISIYRAIQQVC